MNELLKETVLLDYNTPAIQSIISNRKWNTLDNKNRILSAYNFVRDEIVFGYNIDDVIPASKVLSDGIGQCNTKGILFMALLRALNIPCRLHGFTINKALQRGALKGVYYYVSPQEIVHSWVEVFYHSQWLNLEGFILDVKYIRQLQKKFSACEGSFCGYGVAIGDFKNPPIYWNENDTYIQKDGIAQDFGTFDSPDEFFSKHMQTLAPFKKFLYQNVIRHLMNRNVNKIRKQS